MTDDQGFLERWSRMKRTGKAPAPAMPADQVAQQAQTDSPPPLAGGERGRGEELEPFDLSKLPSLDELTADTDIRGFLDARVPAALRNAALRQMWTLDPAIRDFIEVAENQWNWNVPGGAPFYGPLEPGTDIAALLAQATGAIRSVAKSTGEGPVHEHLTAGTPGSPTQIAAQANPPAELCAAQDQAGSRGGDPSGVDVANAHDTDAKRLPARAPTATPEHVASQQHSEPVLEDGQMVRRRHGGALPA